MGRTRHTRKRHTRRKRKKKRTRRRRRSRHKRKRTRHRRRPRRGGALDMGTSSSQFGIGGGRVCKSGGKTPLMVSDIPPGPGFKKYAQKDKKQARAYLKKLKEGGGFTIVKPI